MIANGTARDATGPRAPHVALPRPQAASTGLATSALSRTERATLAKTAAAIAAELLMVERVHGSPVMQLKTGVSGTFAAHEVDRVRDAARRALSQSFSEPR